MRVYDSSYLPVAAVALAAVVTLTAQPQGTPVPAKAVTQSGGHISISNASLEFSGLRHTGGVSTLTLSGVTNGDSVTIGSKTYVAGTDFVVGGNDTVTATNLAAAINTRILEAQAPWSFHYQNLTIDSSVSGTGAVAFVADIEHSINGVDWSVLTTINISGTGSAVGSFAAVKPKTFLRVKPTTLTGTGAVAKVWVTGVPA